jgi:hypothetical protein
VTLMGEFGQFSSFPQGTHSALFGHVGIVGKAFSIEP